MRVPVLFLSLLLALVATRLYAGDPDLNDVRRSSLKGNVKQVKEICYKAKKRSGEIKKAKRKREYRWQKDFMVTFDERGRKIEKTIWHSGGKIYRKLSYSYDTNGNLTEEKSTKADGSASEIAKTVNTYDNTGMLLERKTYRDDGKLNGRFVYEYDSLGWCYENLLLDSIGMKSVLLRKFDSRRNLTEWNMYTNDGTVLWKYLYTYDANSNRTQESVYSGNRLSVIYKWKYDEQGNLKERDVCGASGENCEVWTYKYEFDAQGNWIKAIEYRNGKPVFIKEREIVYF